MISTDPWIWFGALITIGFMSLLYKDNVFFRFAEVSYASFAIGHTVIVAISTLQTRLQPIGKGSYILIVPTILGILTFLIISKKYSWLAAYPLSILVGVTLSVRIGGMLSGDIVAQIGSVVSDGITIMSGKSSIISLTALISFIATITSLTYFIFTREHTGIHKWSAKLGQYFMMIAFGAYVANMVLSETAFALNKVIFLLRIWLGI